MNDPTPSAKTCPQCGAIVSAQAPEGLCPRCVARLNLLGDSVFTGESTASVSDTPAIEEIAPHFPQLEITECLGRGGMGVVYRARQKSLDRFVALKLIAPERVGDPAFAECFSREAQALAKLNHANIVTIHDFGQAGGFYFLLMEFVDGVNLRQAMQAGHFTPEQALAIVPPVCEALQFAHEHGIVHRDIKPENLLLDKDGGVKIADFGIAKMLGENPAIGVAESQPAGTPQYMAPEQKEHHRTDHRADIYSLGVVLYEMLTGEQPAEKIVPPSKRVQMDVRLDEIVLRALEQEPELRYQSATEFRTQVETYATTRSAPPADQQRAAVARSVWAALMALAGILIVFALFQDLRSDRVEQARAAVLKNGNTAMEASALQQKVVSLERQIAVADQELSEPVSEKAAAQLRARSKALDGKIVNARALARRAEGQVRHTSAFAGGISVRLVGMLLVALLLGCVGTVAGWRHLRRLRGGPAPRAGLGIALFAALFVPLLAVDFSIGSIILSALNFGHSTLLGIILANFAVIVVNIWIVERLVRWLAFTPKRSNGWFRAVRWSVAMLIALPWLVSANSWLDWIKPWPSDHTAIVTTRNVHLDATAFTFDYTVKPPAGWAVWLITSEVEKSSAADDRQISAGRNTRMLSSTGSTRVDLKGLQFDDESLDKARAGIGPSEEREVRLSPGHNVALLDFTTAAGQSVNTVLEMRPTPVAVNQPACQIYLQKVLAYPEGGIGTMSYNVISQPEGYDLVVETTGASAKILPPGSLVFPLEVNTAEGNAVAEFPAIQTVEINDADGVLRWNFPSTKLTDHTWFTIAAQFTFKTISPGVPLKIFILKDSVTGRYMSVKLKLVSRTDAPVPEK